MLLLGEKVKSEEKNILHGKLTSMNLSFIRYQINPDIVSEFLESLQRGFSFYI